MAGTYNPEDTVSAIISTMKADLAAQLAILDAEFADSIVLEEPAAYHRSFLQVFPKYPVCIVDAETLEVPDRYRGENAQPSGAYGENINSMDLFVGILLRTREQVVYTDKDSNTTTLQPPEVLTITMYRMLQATRKVLEDNDKLILTGTTKNCDKLLVRGITYPAVRGTPDASDMYEKEGYVLLRVYVSP